MSKHMQRELAHVEKRLIEHCATVEKSVALATQALEERRGDLAHDVIAGDTQIDLEEVAIEEECLKILALHQPVATDLRFVVAALKINNDLERIGDLAANIAKRAISVSSEPVLPDFFDFGLMARKTMAMLRDGVDSLVRMDMELARRVCEVDDEVDSMNSKVFELVQAQIQAEPAKITVLLQYLSVSRQLERIADHATNIAQDVIYMITGDIVRHGAEAVSD
jgi:phosphate transport system protein